MVFKNNFDLNNETQEDLSDCNAIKISIASPEKIKSWSHGEVKESETINYRTGKPEKHGLFCPEIFGPTKDYECFCGKYKQIKYKGVVCEKCHVEVTTSDVRRKRFGHIELVTPVAHIWFIPKIEILLGCGQGKIKDVIYYEKYIVTDAKMTELEDGQILSESQVEDAKEKYGSEAFEVGIGAESVQKLLAKIDLEKEKKKLISRIKDAKLSKSEKIKNIKKLNLIEDFLKSGNKLEWMILTSLPVIPPDLRPIVQLESGQWSTGDLNELYRRILNRNNRLKVLIELDAPDLLVKTGKKLLQQMVDALFDNEKIDNPVKTMNKRQFKSLSDSLKGKSGRFRQNLLGKRVDYSGRTVIVVGSELKINQCGLPKKMALELFRPFVYAKLEQYGYSDSIKESKKMVDEEELIVWDILEEVIKDHPVLLNRPPTLHRLSIQAFDPILVEGNAIQVHPLVCAAFNADFDGDAMAVHIPLSIEAQIEAKVLMMSTNNILHPKDGKPMITPTCDMMFGIYYITMDSAKFKEKPIIISSYDEMEQALFKKIITLNDYIIYRFKVLDDNGNWINKTEKTTAGRVKIFNAIPENARTLQVIPMFNKTILKADIKDLLDYVYRATSQYDTCLFGDAIMQIGFKESCKSGISVGKDDILVPKNKEKQITDTKTRVNEIQQNYNDGLITENERYNKIVTSWSNCSDELSKDMLKQMEDKKEPSDANSLYMLMKSGARGNKSQIQQMCSMRGLMTDASGGIIEVPIVSNLKEGLSGYEYFISTNLARKGFATVALLTAKGGYFTRKLLGIAQDIVVTADDCGSEEGIDLQEKINSKGQIVTSLSDRALGRTLSKDVLDLTTNKVLLKNGTLIGEAEAKILAKANIKKIEVRSALTCKCKDGICAKCYGRDLSSGNLVTIGDAVGVIAAQAIGEPGTQLTLNTKHNVGGSTSSIDFVTTPYDCSLNFKNYNDVVDKNGNVYVISRNFIVEILDENKHILTSFNIPYGAKIFVKNGSSIKQGEKLAEWDKLSLPIIATYSGKVDFGTLKLKKRYDSENDSTIFIVTDKNPSITIGDQLFELQNGAILNIQDKDDVQVGDVIAKIQKGILTKGDITGGLNEVEHLFELTKRIFVEAKSELALISEVSGIVNIKKSNTNGKKKIQILDKKDRKTVLEEYDTYSNINILVEDGDEIKRGDYLLGGEENPNDILRINGISAFVKYMTENVQKIYESQGISISDKHIELILSRMITNVEIIDNGDSELNIGDVIDKYDFDEENKKVVERGLIPMISKGVALGLTETSVKKSKSFIAAMSLQNTQEILVKSSIRGQTDDLRGLKENMIIGRLMPAGTGLLVNKIKKNI